MRLACLLIAAVFLLYSVWFFYDGLVAWPKENQRVEALQREQADAQRAGDVNAADRAAAELSTLSRHTDIDLVIQKALGVAFAVMALVLLCIAAWPRSKKALPPPPLPPPVLPS